MAAVRIGRTRVTRAGRAGTGWRGPEFRHPANRRASPEIEAKPISRRFPETTPISRHPERSEAKQQSAGRGGASRDRSRDGSHGPAKKTHSLAAVNTVVRAAEDARVTRPSPPAWTPPAICAECEIRRPPPGIFRHGKPVDDDVPGDSTGPPDHGTRCETAHQQKSAR